MSLLLRNYGETDFITGLRFIAAAMVIAIHTQAFRDFGALGNVITDNGKYGVHIFFVISGFTIARTYRSSGGYGRFVGRRMMRIAPLYYLLILIAFVLMQNGTLPRGGWMDYYGVEPDSYNLLMHLTFLSGFDARIANSLLGVEWSIPVEVFWYLVLPLVLPVTMQAKRRLAIFLGLLVLAGLTRVADHLWLPDHAAHFMPFSYGALFYLGALAETWRNQARDLAPRQRVTLTGAAIVLFVIALVTDTGLNAALFAVATAGLIVWRESSVTYRGMLSRRPFIFLGSISYSLYLSHPLVLHLVVMSPVLQADTRIAGFGVALLLTTAFSVVTYLLVEYPSNALGRKLFGLSPSPDPHEPDQPHRHPA